jgi:hypothetical protein
VGPISVEEVKKELAARPVDATTLAKRLPDIEAER